LFVCVAFGLGPASNLSAAPAVSSPPAPNASATATTPATDAPGGGTPRAVAALREVVALQKATLAAAREAEDEADVENLRPRLQKVVDGYEAVLKDHPDFAAAWAAYGLYLCEPLVEERRPALALLLKANGLDPNLAVVKNQIGVLMAEDGRVIDALNYFLAASDLAPNEPLYHFQIGLVLDEGREHFLKSQAWSAATIDSTLVAAFARAVALAPDRTDFAYRAAEAYYDLATPRWDEAHAAWSALQDHLTGPVELQTVRLHLARVRWKQGLAADAREILATVDEPTLAVQKAKLAAEFAADDAAETKASAAK
jgi:tetratricopeptide (TPR) repeat protein